MDADIMANRNPTINSIAFVDGGLFQASDLMNGIQADRVVFMDDPSSQLEQITSTLAQYDNLDSIHIFSHGDSGALRLGDDTLEQSSLNNYETDLRRWGKALNQSGDLLLYGCNLAATPEGMAFVDQLSQITGADVAASSDTTGHRSLGGDWTLEVSTGEIAAAIAVDLATQASYEAVLPITIFAAGAENTETMELRIDGNTVRTWNNIGGNPDSRTFEAYRYNAANNVAPDRISIAFTNDLVDQAAGIDRNLHVDRIVVDGQTIQTEDPKIFSTGTWKAEDGVVPGFRMSEILNANGEFRFADTTNNNSGDIVQIRARGTVGGEQFSLSLGGTDVTTFTTTTANQIFSYRAEGSVTADDVRVGFLNDRFDPTNGIDSNLIVDYVTVDGDRFETEAPTVFSTGTWKPTDGIVPGFRESEILHNNGYFQYAAPTASSSFALQSSDTVFVSEDAGSATFTALRTGSSRGRATLEFITSEVGNDSATAGEDYRTPTLGNRPNTGQIVFEDGETEKTFSVAILDDDRFEGTESFSIGLQNPSTGSLGAPRTLLVDILDNDAPATLSLSNAAITASESNRQVELTVQRSGDSSEAASVRFRTRNGSAQAGDDYTARSGRLNFAAGQTTRTIAIDIEDDAFVENSENFTVELLNPVGGVLGSQQRSTVTILDNDLELGNLERTTAVSGLSQPTTLDWTPDGQYMLVAQKSGEVRVVDENGNLRANPLVDLSGEVNDTRDRGLLGMAIHPEFPSQPYVYLLYTYDPPETVGRTGLGGPDGQGNRPSRMVRLTVNPNTMVADPTSKVIMAGSNSTWEYTNAPTGNSTGDTSIRPSGIVGGDITAPASQIDRGTQDNDPDRAGLQNGNIRDYLATDSESHSIGDLEFGADGFLYLSNGDGTSYNFPDPRTVRVQDINNLSGKLLRIDPITGEGVSSNPFYDGDGDSNASKVFYSGLRNPFRFTFDPLSDLPVIGDVGWTSWEEINTGVAGSNFGWPYLEGPNPTGEYNTLPQAVSFYGNGNRNNPGDTAALFPLLSRSHGAPDNANAIVVGDYYNSNTLMFGDVNSGTLYAATLDSNREVSNVQVFDSDNRYVVDMKMGPDGKLYGVNLVSGNILRWEPDASPTNLNANLNDFADLASLNLNGSAAGINNRLRLTDTNPFQAGSTYLTQALQIDGDTSFSSQFQFQISGGQGNGGADGFSFVLQNSSAETTALGSSGGDLGYAGIGNSLAVEFDTYDNGSRDINGNHLSILRNGNVDAALKTANAPFNLNGGTALTAWVDYSGTTNQLEVYLSNNSVKPSNALLTEELALDAFLGNQAYVGFTAGTGGLANNHDILNWSFNS